MPSGQMIVSIAQNELAKWKAQSLVECIRDPHTHEPIGESALQAGSAVVAQYWSDGVGDHHRNGCTKVAWSAAFICWCLRQAGVRIEEFPFSAAHHSYIRWAIRNELQAKAGKLYYGMRPEEYSPKPGDIIAQWRKEKVSDPDPNITYDVQPDAFYSSHCDIVTHVSADVVTTIGGNLSDRVKDSRFAATNSILKPKKEFICILRLAD